MASDRRNFFATQDWKVPGYFTPDGDLATDKRSTDLKLGWLREAIDCGAQYLRNQRSYVDMDRALDIVAGTSASDGRKNRSLSGVRVNRAKRNVREIVASLSNLRPLWGYKNDNHDFDNHGISLNKMLQAWWLGTFADRRVRSALQYASVLGGGYVSPVWQRDFWTSGRGDISLNVYGPRDVLFVQLPADHNIQKAYAVVIRISTPVHIAHRMWPLYADKLKPKYMSTGGLKQGLGRVTGFVSPILRRLGGGQPRKEEDDTPFPMLDIYHTYIMDGAINLGPKKIVMGEPGTNWAYEVPVFGDKEETAALDPNGRPYYRQVDAEDARLFPGRRLMISCPDNNVVMSDGPSPWWYPGVPLVKFALDDWPWELLGYSLMRDQAPLQASRINLMRAVDDAANARLRPNLFYDMDVLAKALMDDFDPRRGGQNIPAKLSMIGEPIKTIINPQFYDQPAWIAEYLKGLDDQMDHMVGVRDFSAIAKARQIPATESIDKIMEMAGPLITDMSRSMEASLRDLGEMWKCLAFQFYTTARKVQVLGQDGITEEDYDYDPGNMVPSHLAGESRDLPSPTPIWKRARWHMENFVFHVTPNSLHQITQMTRKMLYLQLYRMAGMPFPMDPWTLADQLDIHIGSPPEGTSDMVERWAAWAKQAKDLMQQLGGAPGGKGAGRPPSGNAPPHLQVKQGGRTTVAESR